MVSRFRLALLICLLGILTSVISGCGGSANGSPDIEVREESGVVYLPEPDYESDVSLEYTLLSRRSVRTYSDEPLLITEISQLLWAAQGITDEAGHRTAPSAVAIYPLKLYLIAGNVKDLSPGIFTYEPEGHRLIRQSEGDYRNELAAAAMGQSSVRDGAVSFVVTADFDKVIMRFDEKGERFTCLEAGHAAQNLCLQATALDLGFVTAGAIYDDRVAGVMDLPDNLTPLYVIPVGRKK